MLCTLPTQTKLIFVNYKKLLFLAAFMSLTGCATGYAPVSDLNSPSTDSYATRKAAVKLKRANAKGIKSYKVKKGDTLYSIAWKYGLDFRKLAQKNNIGSDYLIRNGQVLAINSSTNQSLSSTNRNHRINGAKVVSANKDTNKKSKEIKTKKTVKKTAKSYENERLSTKKSTLNKKSSKYNSNVRWRWPAKGKVVNKFSKENKGLDLSGRRGDSVYAAASGKVVYAGNGIIGYGNLIIIKHSQQYLSAYAHNSVILIKEKNSIKAGQKIAEIGSSGTIKTILHFEIRKDGKPVDPLKYLPKK